MTTPELEHILRNPPTVRSSASLLADLQRQIALPKTPSSRSAVPFWKQWIPALSFGLLVLGCIVALGVQARDLIQLKRENRTLREQVGSGNVTPEAPPNSSATSALSEESAVQRVERRADGEVAGAVAVEVAPCQRLPELRASRRMSITQIEVLTQIERLRAEVDQLRQQLHAADQLSAEQAQLQEQLKAATAQQRDGDPFAAYKNRADAIVCISNLKQIGLAARMWSFDHNQQLPPDFISMRKELNTPEILVCPADTTRLPAASWEQWTPARVTYEYFGAGTSEQEPSLVLTRCPIHGSVGINDGSAHDSPKLATENGRLKILPGRQ